MKYHAKGNKLDRKTQEPHDFTHMWAIKLKQQQVDEQQTNKNSDTDNSRGVTRGKGIGNSAGKRYQI